MKNIASLFAVAALTAVSQAAMAVTMDFNSLAGAGLVNRGASYSENEFQLAAVGSNEFGLASIQSGDYRYTGTPSMLNFTNDGITELTRIGGGSFTLSSIDLDTINSGEPVTVTFEADKVSGQTVTQSFTTDLAFLSLQTVVFSGFDEVWSVRWTQARPFHSFDNIVVAPGQVPVPAPLALLSAGAIAAAMARRRAQ